MIFFLDVIPRNVVKVSKRILKEEWMFTKRIGIFLAVLGAAAITNRSDAAVGLCVKDDSLAKIAAVNTSNSASGWEGGWGDGWTVRSTDGQYVVEGIAACLNTTSKSGTKPSTWDYGMNCWCNVISINNKVVSGAWVFHYAYGSYDDCYSYCAINCSDCVRYGTVDSCTRSALFAAP
jgi:hypothetical protein